MRDYHFIIEPVQYASPAGMVEKLTIKVHYNGQDYTYESLLDEQPIFENRLEYCTKLALKYLEEVTAKGGII